MQIELFPKDKVRHVFVLLIYISGVLGIKTNISLLCARVEFGIILFDSDKVKGVNTKFLKMQNRFFKSTTFFRDNKF